eukprot:3030766-Prymnesium_polylepis.2
MEVLGARAAGDVRPVPDRVACRVGQRRLPRVERGDELLQRGCRLRPPTRRRRATPTEFFLPRVRHTHSSKRGADLADAAIARVPRYHLYWSANATAGGGSEAGCTSRGTIGG